MLQTTNEPMVSHKTDRSVWHWQIVHLKLTITRRRRARSDHEVLKTESLSSVCDAANFACAFSIHGAVYSVVRTTVPDKTGRAVHQ